MLYFEKLILREYIEPACINISQRKSTRRVFIVVNLKKKDENAEATDENRLRRNDGSA